MNRFDKMNSELKIGDFVRIIASPRELHRIGISEECTYDLCNRTGYISYLNIPEDIVAVSIDDFPTYTYDLKHVEKI